MNSTLPYKKSLLYSLVLTFLLTLAYSCGGDDDDGPIPTPKPTPTTETVSIIYETKNSDEVWSGWKDGFATIRATPDEATDKVTLSKTVTVNKSAIDKTTANKSASFSLDSVTAYDGDYLTYKEKNVTLSSTPKTVDVTENKLLYSHTIEWLGNSENSKWVGWKDGKAYSEQSSTREGAKSARIIYKFLNGEIATVIDSLKGTLEGYKDIVTKEIAVANYLLYTGGNEYGEYQFVRTDTGGEETSTGDVAIRINHEGNYKSQSTITMTNLNFPEYTYGPFDTQDEVRYIFKDLHIETDGLAQYKATVTSNLEDFLTTELLIEIAPDVEGEVNGVKDVFVTDVPHMQAITWTIVDSKTHEPERGVFIEVFNAETGDPITGGTSDSQGRATVERIPDDITIMTKTSRFDSYRKITGTHKIPDVEFTYQMTDELNTTNIKLEFSESTGQQITSAQLNLYRPVPNLEWNNGHAYTYFPPSGEREGAIEGSKELAKELGKEGTIRVSDNPFQDPSQSMIANYNPYQDANTYPGQIGSNWELGSKTTNYRASMPNGTRYVLHSPVFKFGKITLAHEWFQRIGFPQITDGEEGITTSLDPENPKELTPMDKKMHDIYYGTNDTPGLIPNHFTHTINGKPVEYSIKIKEFK